jgi:NADH:ubiquinone oxidoreductase subunit 6 (subunit J)
MIRKEVEKHCGVIESTLFLAVLSFLLGTLILGIYAITESPFLAIIGVIYLAIAILINSIFLTSLLYRMIRTNLSKYKYLISIAVLISNIPIAYFCLKIAIDITRNWFD